MAWDFQEVRTAAQVCALDGDSVVPAAVFALPKRQIALFLRTLFSGTGGVTVRDSELGGEIFLFASHRRLLDRVSILLLRFGISVAICRDGPEWVLDIEEIDSQRRFLQEIGIEGAAEDAARRLLLIVRSGSPERVPEQGEDPWWSEVAEVMAQSSGASEGLLGSVAMLLDRAEVDLSAVNDVEWETVVAVIPDGTEEVYDATVLGGHNFLANGVSVHNSIEQDADVVMLLHRESMYEQDSPAKERPTSLWRNIATAPPAPSP